jgi:thermitase
MTLQLIGFILTISTTAFAGNWGLKETDSINAWKETKGNKNVIVGVVDTGVDFTHPSLSHAKVKEKGWDFVNNKLEHEDLNGHGTHVAGIIAAKYNKENQTGGVSPDIKIISYKWYSENLSNSDAVNNSVAAINKAVEDGVKIINYSAGGRYPNQEEKEAIENAGKQGVIFVVAAGNEMNNINDGYSEKYYPCSYNLPNVICVGGVTSEHKKTNSSNYGAGSVFIFAPGEDILSTLPNGRYGMLTGTSQATPFVTGAIALMLSKNPNLTVDEIKMILAASAETEENLKNKAIVPGILNTSKAIAMVKKEKYKNNNLYVQKSLNKIEKRKPSSIERLLSTLIN